MELLGDDDHQRIRALIDSRRQVMHQQLAADETKSGMCLKIQNHKASIPGLKEKIQELEYYDEELFKYIRNLEFINASWCHKCNKNIDIPNHIYDRGINNAQLLDELNKLRISFETEYKKLEAKVTAQSTMGSGHLKHLSSRDLLN